MRQLTHRPWAAPSSPWRWKQAWHDLLFMHWPVPVAVIRPFVSSRLEIDVRDGTAWLGLVPFRMTDVTLRHVPALPWLSAFPEMNLRTYVTHGAKPGVWFLRMDASRALAVIAARATLALPYVWSSMTTRHDGDRIVYASGQGRARFRAAYGPESSSFVAKQGSLEEFLTERYCLYTVKSKRLLRVEIHHRPWVLQAAAAEVETNTVAASLGLPGPSQAPHLLFARLQETVGWGAELVA
jgi:uncharacterized protein YqjF (DUF2071 family)